MNLWSSENDSSVRLRLTDAVTLTAESDPPMDSSSVHPRLLPTAIVSNVIAGLLVPPDCIVTRNGVPLAWGVHALQHGDRIDHADHTWWVSASREISAAPYDAAVHGEDVHCFITRARLQPAELIIVCPGPAGAECGAIYRQPAWEMVQQNNARFHCPRCGFDPAEEEWQPTLPRQSNLPRLFELARQRREEGVA